MMAYVGVLNASNSDVYACNGFAGPRATATCLRQESLEVHEMGKALKVQTDKPHLVSLGSGRLSTSITLHPLHEGLTRIGGPDALTPQDIVIVGTGVDDEHCIIENDSGVVTLCPISERTSVDGCKVTTPVRLVQGSMICLGRSNYFRFNHPEEAQLMKSIFPNSRISVVPLNFSQEMPTESFDGRSPLSTSSSKSSTVSPTSSNRNSDKFRDELESEDFVEKVSKFEFLSHNKHQNQLSPSDHHHNHQQLWFVRDGLRSPQYYPYQYQQSATLPRSSSSSSSRDEKSPISSPIHKVGVTLISNNFSPPPNVSFNQSSTMTMPSRPYPAYFNTSSNTMGASKPKSISVSYKPPIPSSTSTTLVSSTSSKGSKLAKIDTHISPKVFLPTSSTSSHSSLQKLQRHLPGRCTPTYHRQNGLGNHCSLEDLHNCERTLEKKHQKVLQERLREQELEAAEQMRLEEILTMCAEYERHQSRQKLHGSVGVVESNVLKGSVSVGASAPPSTSGDRHNSRERPDSSTSSGTGTSPVPNSPAHIQMNRIKTNGSLPRDRNLGSSSPRESVTSPPYQTRPFKSTSSEDELDRIFDFSQIIGEHNDATVRTNQSTSTSTSVPSYSSTYPQSPRTRIKTVVNSTVSASNRIFKNPASLSHIGMHPHQEFDTNRNNLQTTKQLSVEIHSPQSGNSSIGVKESVAKTVGVRSLTVSPKGNSGYNGDENFDANSSRRSDKSQDSTLERNGDTLRTAKANLVQILSDLKNKILQLESQENEALSELELECALLDGEYEDQTNVLRQEQEALKRLQLKEGEMSDTLQRQRNEEHFNIISTGNRVDKYEKELMHLEKQIILIKEEGKDVGELSDKIQQQRELLESERKNFEDMEFRLLEHDAHRDEEREQIVREQTRLSETCRNIEGLLADIAKQKNELVAQVKKEAGAAEFERQMLLLKFKMERQKLQTIELKTKSGGQKRVLNNRLKSPSASPRSSDGELQNKDLEEKLKQLGVLGRSLDPEDIISRLTSSVPICMPEDGSPISLRTTTTLQEIERSRQKLLEVQGALVIEQQRLRVEELKRQAANEVCAQWKERKQREADNLGSSESERSSASSSDVPAESITSDEALSKFTDSERNSSSVSNGKDSDYFDKVHQKERRLSQAAEDARPLSGSSSQDDWMDVKYREKQRLQRPLTRYLPVRKEDFDLRQHIETAGHQIDHCQNIQLNATSCRGNLHKMGSKFKTWNKRWFVFDRTKRTLMYFADKSEHKPRGGVYFQSIEEVYVDHLCSVKSPNPKVTFCVKTLDRTFYLMAPNAEAMRIWVDVIITGAEGYREFQLDV